jgi:hypothetical protein
MGSVTVTQTPYLAGAINLSIARFISSFMGYTPGDSWAFGFTPLQLTKSATRPSKGVCFMRIQIMLALVALVAAAATEASAQDVNLSGPYQCVVNCAGPGPATVTQNGWDLNLANETGMPSRAWVDWPGHIWVPGYKQSNT